MRSNSLFSIIVFFTIQAAVGEFYRFAQSAGLDMETLQQVVAVSAGGSTQFERNFNKMVADDYRPTFALALLRKDMSIALASAQSQGLSLPLSEEAFRLFKLAAAFDKEDCSAIAKVPEQFGYGFGFTAYMLYLIYYSQGSHQTAHYAICTAFMALGMMIPGMPAGWIQEHLGYTNFFIWVCICTLPGIVASLMIRNRLEDSFGKKQ